MKLHCETVFVGRMRTNPARCSRGLLFALGCAFAIQMVSAADTVQPITVLSSRDVSFGNEIQHAITRGLDSLRMSQNTNGWWSTPDHTAVTALVLTAFMGEPTGRYQTNLSESLAKGYEFITTLAKPDGSIFRAELINYNTSISMMALLAARNPAYDDLLRRGRAFLIKSQIDIDKPGQADSPFDGGVGYGSKYAHSDMNNTLNAVEAIYYTRHLVVDSNSPVSRDLNWAALIQFIQNCQNLPSYNQQGWVTDDATNKGGFVYYPGHSMAGAETNAATGRVALRSYGSVSYSGLLSYIYADLKRDDPRVVAVLDWLRSNYTLDENPGMELQGLYYYLHLMTKALNTRGLDTLDLKDGRKVDWRREVAMRLINLQQRDGSWSNTNGRWWEKDPNLVTAYAVFSLEIIHGGFQ
ncbi:MAG: cycloartenol synthase [Pedosphaera sp.]|nr:cycloartenol synthase [Pedosphaera sp.]